MRTRILFVAFLITISIAEAQQNFTLPQAIDYALEHNLSIEDADLDAKNAEWQYKQALSIGMPKLNGNVNYTYYYKVPISPVQDFISPSVYGVLIQEQVTTENGTITPANVPEPQTFSVGFQQKHNLSLGLNAEGILFDGNFLKGLKAAKQFIALSQKQKILTEQEIINNVIRAYQSVLIVERNRSIIDNNISNIQVLLESAQLTYDNGYAEQLDVDRLELSLQNLKIEEEKLERLIEVNYNMLKYQMAYPISDPIRVNDELEGVVETLLIDPQQYLDSIDPALRPEYRLLVDAIELDYVDLDRIKAGYLPVINASLWYGQSLNRNGLFNSNEAGFLGNGAIGLSARIPIYDGGRTKSLVEQKKIVLEKRENELQEFERGMQLQVYNAQILFENAKSTLAASKRTLELNEKIYNTTKIKFEEGIGSSLEVINAESSLYGAQAQYVNSLYDLLSAHTELQIASGQSLQYK